MSAVIELSAVARAFGSVRAVDGVTLSIARGEVVGLLGHNGAGKTTLVRVIAGLLAPTSGSVRVAGLDPVADGLAVRRLLGVLPTGPFLDLRLTAQRNLEFAADLFGLPRSAMPERVSAALAEFELADRADDKVEGFSAGMRQRLALARVLLPEPEILLLDEPSAALDPLAVRMVRELIGRLSRDSGRTVVLCTHDLVEAQLLCDRVVVLDHGKVAAAGTPFELAGRLATGDVEIEVAREDVTAARAGFGGPVSELPGTNGGGTVVLRGAGPGRSGLPELVRRLAVGGVRIYGVRPHEPSLEEVYVALYDRSHKPSAAPAAEPTATPVVEPPSTESVERPAGPTAQPSAGQVAEPPAEARTAEARTAGARTAEPAERFAGPSAGLFATPAAEPPSTESVERPAGPTAQPSAEPPARPPAGARSAEPHGTEASGEPSAGGQAPRRRR